MNGFRKTLLLNKNRLWIGTEGSGLYCMNLKTNSFISYREESKGERKISSNLIKDLSLAKNGNIYIATDGGGLNILNPINNKVSQHFKNNSADYHLNSNALQCFYSDRHTLF